MMILVKVPKNILAKISEVSKHWLQITRSKYFWKRSCHERWTTIFSDNVDYGSEEIIIPTLKVDNKKIIDWKVYYSLRKKFGKLVKRLADVDRTQDILDENRREFCNRIIECSELYTESIDQLVRLISALSIFIRDNNLLVLFFDFLWDMALQWCQQNNFEWLDTVFSYAYSILHNLTLEAQQFRFSQRVFDLCQLLNDTNPSLARTLFSCEVQMFHMIPKMDDKSKRLFRLMVEFFIQSEVTELGSRDLLEVEQSSPAPGKASVLLRRAFVDDEDLLEILIDVASHAYHNNDDWKYQTIALCAAWVPASRNQKYLRSYFDLAMEAAEHIELKVAQAGSMGLLLMLKQWTSLIDLDSYLPRLIDVFASGLIKFPASGYMFYLGLVKLIPKVKSELLSDDLVDKMVTNIFSQVPLFQPSQQIVAYNLDWMATIFKSRLENNVELVRTTLLGLAQTGTLNVEKLLACYVNFGVAVKGQGFASEFTQLANQILNGELPFEVSVTRCYEICGASWASLVESKTENEQIVSTLLAAVPQEVCEYGQSDRPSTVLLKRGPEELPETFADLSSAHTYNIEHLLQLDNHGQHNQKAKDFVVPSEQLKSVNPTGKTCKAFRAGIKSKVETAYSAVKQLSSIVRLVDVSIIQHAQDVLHAMLAFDLSVHSQDMAGWCQSLTVLMEAVKQNIHPTDLIKYIDIILYQILGRLTELEDPDPDLPVADPKCFFDLFDMCLNTLIRLPISAPTRVIVRVINCHLKFHAANVPVNLELAEFVQHIILAWPRNANEALVRSDLPSWLTKHVNETKLLEDVAPYLTVYARVAALYGMDYTMDCLWAHKSNADYIIGSCQKLYEAVKSGAIQMNETDLMFVQHLLIIQAIHRVKPPKAYIAIIPKSAPSDLKLLGKVLQNKKIETGVTLLTEYISGLDFDNICKLLLINLKDEDRAEPGAREEDTEEKEAMSEADESKEKYNDNVEDDSDEDNNDQ